MSGHHDEEKSTMKLTVPANYDPDVVPELSRYPVIEVYGSSRAIVSEGGAPAIWEPPSPGDK